MIVKKKLQPHGKALIIKGGEKIKIRILNYAGLINRYAIKQV